jgi:hypothetical protein
MRFQAADLEQNGAWQSANFRYGIQFASPQASRIVYLHMTFTF